MNLASSHIPSSHHLGLMISRSVLVYTLPQELVKLRYGRLALLFFVKLSVTSLEVSLFPFK